MRDIHDAPPAFNPEFRDGYGEAINREYTEWSNSHPEHTREEGMKFYQEIAERLREKYPLSFILSFICRK